MKSYSVNRYVKTIGAILLFMLATVIFVASFELLPIDNSSLAIDWKWFWLGIQGGQLSYHTYLHNPPWSLFVLLPLGWLTFKTSWGAITLITLLVLIVSVPQTKRLQWLALVFILVLSFPSIRHLADGNIEGLVIAGILLLLYGYNLKKPQFLIIGLLLSTAKVQETWLLLLVIAILLVRHWPLRLWLTSITTFVAIALLSIATVGQQWFAAMWNIPFKYTEVNMSLNSELSRLQVPPLLILLLWIGLLATTLYLGLQGNTSVSREKAGLLVVASLLLSPYAAANSFVTVLAIGVIPVLLTSLYLGTAILLAVYLPFLVLLIWGQVTWFYSGYWTFVSLTTWLILAWWLFSDTKSRAGDAMRSSKIAT